MAKTKQLREFLEAWHFTTASINRHIDLGAHYEEIKSVSEATEDIASELGVGIAHHPAATMRSRIMKMKDRLDAGQTERRPSSRSLENKQAVRRDDPLSQVATHTLEEGHEFDFANTRILARAGNKTGRELLETRNNRLHKACVTRPTDNNNAAFYRSRRLVQQRLREMQDSWMAFKAEEILGYAEHNEWKVFFSATKEVYGLTAKEKRSSSHRRRNHPIHWEDAISTTMTRTVQRRPQPPFHHLSLRHRSSASSGDQRRPRPPSFCTRNHQNRVPNLQRESVRIERDPR
nr:unnamed protein product [Spirometra erinaceieuropaei]